MESSLKYMLNAPTSYATQLLSRIACNGMFSSIVFHLFPRPSNVVDFASVAALVLLGLLVGTVGAFMGVGGGFIVVPTLILVFGLDVHKAVGTSLSVVLFTGFFSFLAYLRQKRVDWKLGLLLEVFTAPFAFLGGFCSALVPSKTLEILFACLLVYVAHRVWRGPKGRGRAVGKGVFWERKLREFAYSVNVPFAILGSMAAGFCSGFFGIGGGVLKVPVLLYAGTPMHVAVATSSFMIFITASSGVFAHSLLENVLPFYTLCIVPGILFGTQIGAFLAKRTRAERLRKSFAVFLFFMAVLLVIRRAFLV